MDTSLVEVFVHSRDIYTDVGFYREMSLHIECGLAKWAYGELSKKFKGRVLSEEDLTALEQVLEMAKTKDEKVRVYDVSGIADKIRALKRGVTKTPTVIIDGKRYEGLEEISQVMLSKSGP